MIHEKLQIFFQMFSQISRTPDFERSFRVKRCGLYASVYGTRSLSEGKGLLVPCIRRQRFTRSLHKKAKVYQDRKGPQANFLPFGIRKPKLSCSDHVQTYVHRQHTAVKVVTGFFKATKPPAKE